MAHWVGAQGQIKLAYKTQNTPTYDITHREPQTQLKKKFFSIETRWLPESVEGLNTSLAQSTGELYPKKYRPS